VSLPDGARGKLFRLRLAFSVRRPASPCTFVASLRMRKEARANTQVSSRRKRISNTDTIHFWPEIKPPKCRFFDRAGSGTIDVLDTG
jgi:hypothetical protein